MHLGVGSFPASLTSSIKYSIFGGTFFLCQTWGPDFNMKRLRVAKRKCPKWVYRKWMLEYLELNETYLLFGWNGWNFSSTLCGPCRNWAMWEFWLFWPNSKYVSFNSRYSKIHFLYTHFEHFFWQLLGFSHWSQDLMFGRGKKSCQKGPERV